MAPDKKRRNKRKSRTAEVSSASSSSESESESVASVVAPEPEPKKQKQTKAPKTKKVQKADSQSQNVVPNETLSLPDRKVTKDSNNKAFEEFYRRQAAQEFAEDLFKLQSAGDFSAKSVPLLIAALQQGTSCFSAEEKGRVVDSVEG